MREYIATLGPACADGDVLARMLENGMTALRLNLSHGGLNAHPDWLAAFAAAKDRTGAHCGLLLDLQGPELRCGNRETLTLAEGAELCPAADLRLPTALCRALAAGDGLTLDDGKLLLRALPNGRCRVERGGLLPPRKSAALPGRTLPLPPLTEEDRANLALAARYGVTDVMLSFTRRAEDVEQVRAALRDAGAGGVRLIAKIEDESGLAAAAAIAAEADGLCIARGDLGNRLPLCEVPAVQKDLSALCRAAGTPFFVATQLLSSLETAQTPTRAEMNDIFNSALDGAAGFFLTGETAVGRDPANAVRWLRAAAEAATRYMER